VEEDEKVPFVAVAWRSWDESVKNWSTEDGCGSKEEVLP
jgi:hypothetical protein